MIGGDKTEKGGVSLGRELGNRGLPPTAGKTRPEGFVEDGLDAQPISHRGKAGADWESIGESQDEESGADASCFLSFDLQVKTLFSVLGTSALDPPGARRLRRIGHTRNI